MLAWQICGSSPTNVRTRFPAIRPAAPSTWQCAMLAKHHLQDKRDMTIIEVRFPDQNNAEGGQGRSDQRGLALRLDPDLLATLRTLFNQDEAVGRSQMIIRVTRDGFLKKHRAKMVDSIEDYLLALHYLADPLHHQEAVEIVAEATKQKPASFEGW